MSGTLFSFQPVTFRLWKSFRSRIFTMNEFQVPCHMCIIISKSNDNCSKLNSCRYSAFPTEWTCFYHTFDMLAFIHSIDILHSVIEILVSVTRNVTYANIEHNYIMMKIGIQLENRLTWFWLAFTILFSQYLVASADHHTNCFYFTILCTRRLFMRFRFNFIHWLASAIDCFSLFCCCFFFVCLTVWVFW